ncbi:alpha/beta hydrolase [Flindersiella endophytica]
MAETGPAAVAAAVAGMLLEGRFAEIEQLFAPRLRAVASAETLRIGWTGELSGVGPATGIGEPVSEPFQEEDGLTLVSVPVSCERGELTVRMTVDGTGMMHGLRLAPPASTSWQPPGYAAPRKFVEHEVTVGSGPLAVPGTLSLPRGRGPWPGLVLLSGGGSFDRDETSGANKPLKDLAWGLASRGVAVARFDKVTFAHSQAAAEPGFTVADEYVPHAVAAVRLLQTQPGVDAARVFVLGHSLGGRVAPRVAAAEASVAGMVLLAADTQPMYHAVVRVARYLASLGPDSIPPTALEAIERQAALAGSPDLAPTTPAADLPFNWPASYWLDLRGYDPVATAVEVDRPMLILQGARDYQVTVADDLAGWQSALAHRSDVVIRVYDADDHMFFPGSGPSAPADYGPPQHVDPAVVTDIAEWLAPGQNKIGRFFSSLKR